ncbi:MAG: hypothetical protein IJP65_09130, partial [Bacteroidales bacterium]|nr:hypothetical protein [Bacteroidales bacterium]
MPQPPSSYHRIHTSSPTHLALHYDSGMSLWLSVDLMADKYPSTSPSTYCGNNPVRLVDPDGRDIWEVSETTGKVSWKEKSNEHKLYVTDAYGQRTGQCLSMKSDALFLKLSKTDANGNSYFVGGSNDQGNLLKAFLFLADNTKVEWRYDRFRDGESQNFSLATAHSQNSSPTATQIGHSESSVIADVHSHPNARSNYELQSMGFVSQKNGKISYVRGSDYDLVSHSADYQSRYYYVYIAKTKHLYYVRNKAVPAYITTVNTPSDLMFGTLNTK